MSTYTRLSSILLALTFLLTACATAASEPTEITAPASTETAEAAFPPTSTPEAQTRPITTPITSEPLLSLRQRLAEDLKVDEEKIGLLEMRAETWSDGCLGAALPGEMCTMAIVPGYLLYFETPNGKVEVHTDEAMRFYRIVTLLIGSNGSPLVSWNRTGGIAGICWQMHIYMDTSYKILNCNNQQTLTKGSLSQQALDDIIALAADMAPHEWTTSQILGADMFADSYTWFGTGSQPPDAQAQEQLNSYLGSLATMLVK